MNKKNKFILFGVLLVISVNCSSYKSKLYKGKQTKEEARMNAIIDFANTYKTKTPSYYLKGRDFNVFSVSEKRKISNSDIYVLLIVPEINEFSLKMEDSLGRVPKDNFPNRYSVEENKLFLWHDSITPLNKDILKVMDKYGVLDSIDIKMKLNLLPKNYIDERLVRTDDGLKSVYYFLCKEDIGHYRKKEITWPKKIENEIPKIKCP